jgi:hypothetical protein
LGKAEEWMFTKTALCCLSLILILLAFSGSTACQEKQRRSSRYLIPEGYVGWVRVNFNVKDAPALLIEEGYYLFKFPPDGKLNTSSAIEYGWGNDEYYYYSSNTRQKLKATGWGSGGMIWGDFNGAAQSAQGTAEPPHQFFFVGTEEQYKKYGINVEKDDANHPKVGPIDNLF